MAWGAFPRPRPDGISHPVQFGETGAPNGLWVLTLIFDVKAKRPEHAFSAALVPGKVLSRMHACLYLAGTLPCKVGQAWGRLSEGLNQALGWGQEVTVAICPAVASQMQSATAPPRTTS